MEGGEAPGESPRPERSPGVAPVHEEFGRLTPEAKEAALDLGYRFGDLLVAHAVWTARGRPVEAADLRRAYGELVTDDPAAFKNAQSVVTRAIAENSKWERVVYGMTATLFIAGVALLVAGAWWGRWQGVASGSASATFFALGLRMAYNIRDQNFRMRLLAILLDKGGDRATMAEILKSNFLTLYPGRDEWRRSSRGATRS